MKTNLLFFSVLCLSLPVSAALADLNSDNKVDLQDFTIFSRAWDSAFGDANYNAACDFISSPLPLQRRIELADLLVMADNWQTRDIWLDIYSHGWGHYCDTVLLPEEGSWLINFTDPEPPYIENFNPTHYAYVFRDRSYTEMCHLTTTPASPFHPPYEYNATVNVDLDPIDPNLFNGTIFLTQPFFASSYLMNTPVEVFSYGPEPILEFTTDAQGRFAVDLEPNLYWIRFYEYEPDPATIHEHEFIVSGYYNDFKFPSVYILLKPNIYLYPENTTDLTVHLSFPNGGTVLTSEPDYGNGWDVTAEPSGLIDQQYEFLFYESSQPDFGQYSAGWVVGQSELETFFRSNLAATGFNTKEIADFIAYWIPLLDDYPVYAIYPQYNQQLENMVQLSFSTPPQNVIRVMYAIRGLPNDTLVLPQPSIPPYCRTGFTVAEWGVMLK